MKWLRRPSIQESTNVDEKREMPENPPKPDQSNITPNQKIVGEKDIKYINDWPGTLNQLGQRLEKWLEKKSKE
jgi:hypothetical protein